jgi:hypothetical protein
VPTAATGRYEGAASFSPRRPFSVIRQDGEGRIHGQAYAYDDDSTDKPAVGRGGSRKRTTEKSQASPPSTGMG